MIRSRTSSPTRARAPLPLLAALALAPLVACDCGEDPLTRTEPDPPEPMLTLDAGPADTGLFPDAAAPDAEVDAGPADTGVPEARVLRFDGAPPVVVYFGGAADLRFTLHTQGGVAVPSETVRFSFTGTGGALGATSATTDSSGAALVRFVAGPTPGMGTLTAAADHAPSITVAIEVREDPAATLVLEVVSAARIPVASAEAWVYVSPAATAPSCAQLLSAATLPAPTFTATLPAVPGQSTWTNATSGELVTAHATGETANGVTVARGCTEGVRLAGGTATTVRVTLDQLAPQLDGEYDALLAFDLGATLPPPLGPTVVLITDILADPAGWVVFQTLSELDASLGFGLLEWTPPGSTTPRPATLAEVRANPALFPAWELARDWLDQLLVDQLGQAYVDVTTAGADLAHLVRGFEVGAGFTITSTGTPDRVLVEETWKALVFQWQLGCPAGDLGCARRPLELSGGNAHLAPAAASYGATVVYAPLPVPAPGVLERHQLILDNHELVLRYGAVILLALNELVFPNLPPSIAGNSLTEVLENIVDCPDVALALEASTGLPAVLFESFCTTAVTAAGAWVEAQVLALDSQNNPGLITGLSPNGGGELVLVDQDLDLATELVEQVETYASWSTGQSVTTPITGYGRRHATGCGDDADCAAGLVCVLVPSYLEVRALEQDCRAPLGAGAGGSACTQATDCATGVCLEATPGIRTCFAACDGAASCPAGTCVAGAAAVDLDPVLAGLGAATAASCVP